MFAGIYAPAGWMFCEGQLLAISENETLYNLIGTTYGGDGQATFGLPDLRGRLPLHQGNGFILAETGGAEEITLTEAQIPAHSHGFQASTEPATTTSPGGATWAEGATSTYRVAVPDVILGPGVFQGSGGSQSHTNLQPYLCVNFIISLFGTFPSSS
jgi:microcystin-dependent protein